MALEQLVGTANKLYETRAACRQVLGDRFEYRIKPYQQLIQEVAASDKSGLLAATLRVAKSATARGDDPMLIIAAGVELIDPTEKQA